MEDAGRYFDRKEISRVLQGELTGHGTNIGIRVLTRLADYSKDTVPEKAS